MTSWEWENDKQEWLEGMRVMGGCEYDKMPYEIPYEMPYENVIMEPMVTYN